MKYNPFVYNQLILDKRAKTIQKRTDSIFNNGVWKIMYAKI